MQNHDFQEDINKINNITIVPIILDTICKLTGMGFAAIARVTEDRWVTCSSKDNLNFGLKPGDELQVKTTICDEIRDSGNPVIIDCVKDDAVFCTHHTPAMYGFQSYISIPIICKDGSFFGTLCAIDPEPKKLKDSAIFSMFTLFSDLISFHLSTMDSVKEMEESLIKEKAFTSILETKVNERTTELVSKNEDLLRINKELESFNYISNHDMQEPLRKIQTMSSLIMERESKNISVKGMDYLKRLKKSAERMQALINDFLLYAKTNYVEKQYETVFLSEVVLNIQKNLQGDIHQREVIFETSMKEPLSVIPFQFQQLLSNLISNSLKFSSSEKPLLIKIKGQTKKGMELSPDLKTNINYHHISIEDNGIGFEQQYNKKIFELFQRLNDKTKYEGSGIGLTIVKKIIENHNGIISAEGKVNKGAIFHIYIPADPFSIELNP